MPTHWRFKPAMCSQGECTKLLGASTQQVLPAAERGARAHTFWKVSILSCASSAACFASKLSLSASCRV